MPLCTRCRLSLLQALRPRPPHARALSTGPSSARELLSRPSWSVRSLLSDDAAASPDADAVTPAQLRHLLRLAALPAPASAAEEASMLATLRRQLRFVRAVQRVSTAGVEPLRAIRDESAAGEAEGAVRLGDLREALGGEERVGHYQRPRRVREKVESDAERWDALATARRREGRYFVVQGGKKSEDEAAG